MAAAAILHVGEDICRRIPVMEALGHVVYRSEPSVDGIRSALASGSSFSVITFHNDLVPPSPKAVSTARSLSSAPLILFENPSVDSDERIFDYIIPAQIPPLEWLRSLGEAIERARMSKDVSQQLRAECADARATTRRLREAATENRVKLFDSDSMWHGEADSGSEDADPADLLDGTSRS